MSAIAGAQADRVCLSCHDGRLASAEKHPIGRPIPTGSVKLPEHWPVADGRLGCLTCHDLTPTSGHHGQPRDQNADRPLENPNFLRGTAAGPRLAFCGQCHVANAGQTRFNPHRMLSADGKIQEQACLFCHTSPFAPGRLSERTGDAALKRDAISLCIGCHTQHVDFFEPGHIGVTATPEIVARMAAADRQPPGQPVPRAEIERASQRRERPVRMPLGRDNIVVCSTCHNPHQAGVFPGSSVLAIGAISLREPSGMTKEGSASLQGVPHASSRPSLPGAPHLEIALTKTVAVRLGSNLCGECHGK